MAKFDGNDGVVRVGSNPVAEINAWSVTETAQVKPANAMGDTTDEHLIGRTGWSGSMTCWWDDTDTNGQEALTIGVSVTLNLRAEGSGSGADNMSGTASITEVGVSLEKDGIVERNFAFLGNGALTHGTVA